MLLTAKSTLILEVIVYGLIGYFASTIVHETGHVVCGLINKWKFMMLVVGPFKLYREDLKGKIRFGIEKDVALWGGVGGTFPEKNDESVVDVFARILLAGPLASMLLGVLLIPVFIFTKSKLALMISMIAIAEGLVCILPMNIKTGILYNDGTRFKRIVKHGQAREEEKALFSILITGMYEGEDAVFDDEAVATLTSSEEVDYQYYGLFYAYLNAGKAGDEEKKSLLRQKAESLKDKASKYTVSVCVME